jgi:aminopeptidase N
MRLHPFASTEWFLFFSLALDIGASVTDFYQNFFDVKYPLPKLDMAAIPDYSSGK